MKVPKEVLPRFLDIGEGTFVPLEAVIARHLDALFPGMEVLRHAFFRVARDADFEVSDEADDLLRAVENELRQRRFGEVVRLEVDASRSTATCARSWSTQLGIEEDGGRGRGRPARPDRPLADPRARRLQRAARAALDAGRAPALRTEDGKPDVFAAMRAGDILVHHPYDSFAAASSGWWSRR